MAVWDSARLVTVKRIPCGLVKALVVSHHENPLSVLELYKFDSALFIITDYTLSVPFSKLYLCTVYRSFMSINLQDLSPSVRLDHCFRNNEGWQSASD